MKQAVNRQAKRNFYPIVLVDARERGLYKRREVGYNMNDEQFGVMMDVLQQITKNTNPPGKARQVLDNAGLVVGIGGIFAVIEQIIQLCWRK
jgi:hypothetical protein